MISFFSDGNFITGADYSHREDCIHVSELDIPAGTEPVLSKKGKKYSVSFIEIQQTQEAEKLSEPQASEILPENN